MKLGGYQVLEALKSGPLKISQLRNSVPLYGSAFDLVLSQLMLAGLVRRFEKDGEEYVELTDLGKSFPYYWGHGLHPGWFYGHHHWHHHWW